MQRRNMEMIARPERTGCVFVVSATHMPVLSNTITVTKKRNNCYISTLQAGVTLMPVRHADLR
jgi:hypothetical protein